MSSIVLREVRSRFGTIDCLENGMLLNWDWRDVLEVVIGVVQGVVRLVINVMLDFEMALLHFISFLLIVVDWTVLVDDHWFGIVVDWAILVNDHGLSIVMDWTVFMNDNWAINVDMWAFLMDNYWFSVHSSVVESLTVNRVVNDRDNFSLVYSSMVVASVMVGWCVNVMDFFLLVVLGSAVDRVVVDGGVVGRLVVDWGVVDLSVVDRLVVDGLVVHWSVSVVDRLMVDGSVNDGLVINRSVNDLLMIDWLMVHSLMVHRFVVEMLRMQLSHTRFLRKLWFKAANIATDFFVMRHNRLFSIFAVQSSLVEVFLRFFFVLSLLLRFFLMANWRLPRLEASIVTELWQLVLFVDTVWRCLRMVHDWGFVSLHWLALLSVLSLIVMRLSSLGVLLGMHGELLLVGILLSVLAMINSMRCWPPQLIQRECVGR